MLNGICGLSQHASKEQLLYIDICEKEQLARIVRHQILERKVRLVVRLYIDSSLQSSSNETHKTPGL